MAIVDDVRVRYLADIANFERNTKRATRVLKDELGKQTREQKKQAAEFNRLGAVIGSLQRRVIAFAAAYVGITGGVRVLRAFVQNRVQLERIQNALRVATGSATAASAEFGFVADEAERLGVNLPTAAQQFARLSAAARGTALEGQGVRDIFVGVAEASVVLGLSGEQTAGALTAVEQIISKGRVSAEELRQQLGERLPGAFQIAARAIGKTTAELDDMLVKGELTADELLPALAAELRRTFGPQVADAAQSTQAEINRFETSLFKFLDEMGRRTGIVDSFADAIRGIGEAMDEIGEISQRARIRDILRELGTSGALSRGGGRTGPGAEGLSPERQAELLGQLLEEGAGGQVGGLVRETQLGAARTRSRRPGEVGFAPRGRPEDLLDKTLAKTIQSLKDQAEALGQSERQAFAFNAVVAAGLRPQDEAAQLVRRHALALFDLTQAHERAEAVEKEAIERATASAEADREAREEAAERARDLIRGKEEVLKATDREIGDLERLIEAQRKSSKEREIVAEQLRLEALIRAELGSVTAEEAERLRELAERLQELKAELELLEDESTDLGKVFKEQVADSARDVARSLVDATVNAENFGDAMQSAIARALQDLAVLVLQMTVLRDLTNSLGLTSGGGSGSFLGAILGIAGPLLGAAAGAGVGGAFGAGNTTGGGGAGFSFLGFGGPRQGGGRVEAGVPRPVGELRPEIFVPDQAGRIESRAFPSRLKSGQVIAPVIAPQFALGVSQTVRAEIAAAMPEIARQATEATILAVNRGGNEAQRMRLRR